MRADPYATRTVRLLQAGALVALCAALTLLAVLSGRCARTEGLSAAASAAPSAQVSGRPSAGELYQAFAAAYSVSGAEAAFSATPQDAEAPVFFVTSAADAGTVSRVQVTFFACPSVGAAGEGEVFAALSSRQQQERDRCRAMLDVLFGALGASDPAISDKAADVAAERVLTAVDSGGKTSFSVGAFLLTAAYTDGSDAAMSFCLTLSTEN